MEDNIFGRTEEEKIEAWINLVKEYIGKPEWSESEISYFGFEVEDIEQKNHYSYFKSKDSFIISMRMTLRNGKKVFRYKELYDVSKSDLFLGIGDFNYIVNPILDELEGNLFSLTKD